ncbi:MAG TPA: hypothetical protein VMW49_04645 [Candidatus Dormibacteraeota bacterium]|nr:hypothetical protein [Candidatus Dormibacteraeota bacterium]
MPPPSPVGAARPRGAAVGWTLVLAALGYLWAMIGICQARNTAPGRAAFLTAQNLYVPTAPHWIAAVVRALSHHPALAVRAVLGFDLAVALACLVAVWAIWRRRPGHRGRWLAVGFGLLAALSVCLNAYHTGSFLPPVRGTDLLDEGIPVDLVMAGLELGIAVALLDARPAGRGWAGRLGTALVLLTFAYEWLVSAATKLGDPLWPRVFAAAAQAVARAGEYRWFDAAVAAIAVPDTRGVAAVIVVAEFAIGGAYLVLAARILAGDRARGRWGGGARMAGIVAAPLAGTLTAIYYLVHGGTLLPPEYIHFGYAVDGSLDFLMTATAPAVWVWAAGTRPAGGPSGLRGAETGPTAV